jgi:hypothetical protein
MRDGQVDIVMYSFEYVCHAALRDSADAQLRFAELVAFDLVNGFELFLPIGNELDNGVVGFHVCEPASMLELIIE